MCPSIALPPRITLVYTIRNGYDLITDRKYKPTLFEQRLDCFQNVLTGAVVVAAEFVFLPLGAFSSDCTSNSFLYTLMIFIPPQLMLA